MDHPNLLPSSGIRARIERIPLVGRSLNRFLEVPNPFFSKNSPSEGIVEELVETALRSSPTAKVLNVGSRTDRRGRIINLDISQHGHVDVIGDATFMPFADDSFDAVVNIAVMEHTRLPHLVASECLRVLKPGGRLYCAIPFFQMYHPDPIDVTRYTMTGITCLFQDFRHIDSGVELGPASAMSLTLREFLAISFSFNSNVLYNLLQVLFGYLTYPVKFLDYFLAKNRFAFMIACSVYFLGEKPSRPDAS